MMGAWRDDDHNRTGITDYAAVRASNDQLVSVCKLSDKPSVVRTTPAVHNQSTATNVLRLRQLSYVLVLVLDAVMAAAVDKSHSSYAYRMVGAGEVHTPLLEGQPWPAVLSAAGSRPWIVLLLLLLNVVLCVALSGVLLWTIYCSLTRSALPPSPSSPAVDRSLVSLGLPVSGSVLLSSRTSLVTAMLMNRTATHFSQPAKQGTFVNTNLDGVTPHSFRAALHDYYHSACQRRLNAVVLHDIDPSQAGDYYSPYQQQPYSFLGQTYLCNVTFVYAAELVDPLLYASLHPYDLRWLLYHRYLQLYVSEREYEWLLFSDVSDVTFEMNPFDFMLRQWYEDERHPTVFVGRDPFVLEQHEFCKQRFAACNLSYSRFADRMAVNAGVLAGWLPHVQWLIAALVRYYEHLVLNVSSASLQCRQLGADMAVINTLFLDPTTADEPLQAAPRPLPFEWYAEDSGLVGGAFTGPFAFQRSVPGRQFIRHKTAWTGQQPQEWEHHLRSDRNTKDNCPLLAD